MLRRGTNLLTTNPIEAQLQAQLETQLEAQLEAQQQEADHTSTVNSEPNATSQVSPTSTEFVMPWMGCGSYWPSV
jgi:hypothetical protein